MKKAIFWIAAIVSVCAFYFLLPHVATAESHGEPSKMEQRRTNGIDRAKYEFMLLRDPKTGKIPDGIRAMERDVTRKARHKLRPQAKVAQTLSRGPNNLGGRTRALALDISDPTGRTLLAGGVSSGVFKTTNGGTSWYRTSNPAALHSLTALAQDPTNPSVWYSATGESLGNSAGLGAFHFGDGIWKSTDSGETWSLLETTSSEADTYDSVFDLTYNIKVDPATGDVYAAVFDTIMRSQNGGQTWAPVVGEVGNNSAFSGLTDIAINQNGTRFYAAFHGGVEGYAGIWTSPSGDPGSWTKLAGPGFPGGPADWASIDNQGRVVMAIPPSADHLLYVLYVNGFNNDCDGGATPAPEADLFLYNADDQSWQNRSANLPDEPGCSDGNDPFAVQGGYDLAISVSPIDENLVVIGGTNAYLSTDGFATKTAYTRIGGYASAGGYASWAGHHPDIHALVFDPNQPNRLLCGSDGGVHEMDLSAGNPAWTSLNNNYQTFQYYHVSISPQAGDQRVMGGAQDNGTSFSSGGGTHTNIFGGDGVSVGIAADDSQGQYNYYMGAQRGVIYRLHEVRGYTDIKPLLADDSIFVTLFKLDPSNSDTLYYAARDRLFRTARASAVNQNSWSEMTGIAAAMAEADLLTISMSWGPYDTDSKLYLGTNDGRVFRLNNPRDGAPGTVPADITPFDADPGTVTSIAVDPQDDGTIMVCYSNYGVPSLFFTENADESRPIWHRVEGNLARLSVRQAAIVHTASGREFIVGTSTGLWSSNQLNGDDTQWEREAAGTIGLAVVSSLALRPEDNTLLVGTHGNGMFTMVFDGSEQGSALPFTYYLPEIQVGGDRETQLSILNLTQDFEQMEVLAFDENGSLITNGEINVELDPGGLLTQNVSDWFGTSNIKWIQIGATTALDVVVELQGPQTRSAYRASQLNQTAYLPHIAKDTNSFETVLSLVSGQGPDGDCTLMENPTGETHAVSDITGPFQQSSRPITDYLGTDLLAGPDLWGRIDCSRQVAAMEYFTALPGRSRQAALDLQSEASPNLNFLHVAVDTGQFWTGMVYINVGNGQAAVRETFYDSDGNTLKIENLSLEAGGKTTLLFDADNQVRVPAGTAWVNVSADQPLIGYELFGTPAGSQNDTFTGLQSSTGGSSRLVYPYFRSNADHFTALVAVNLGDSPAALTFTAFDAFGNVRGIKSILNIGPKEKLARLVGTGPDALFTDPEVLENAAYVVAESLDGSFSGFMLWGDQNTASRQYLSGITALQTQQ